MQLYLVKLLVLVYCCSLSLRVLSLKGFSLARYSDTTVYANNSVIDINLVGEGFGGIAITDGGALECHTDDTTCCRGIDNPPNGTGRGEWYYPDGTVVPPPGCGTGLYRTRDHMVIRLNRPGIETESTGLYRCEIPGAGGVIITRYMALTSGGLCHNLSDVSNGFITYTPPRQVSPILPSGQRYRGTVATYSCSPGYQLVGGSSLRACGPDGTWNGTELSCADTTTSTSTAAEPTSSQPPNTSECLASNYLETLSTGEDVCVPCPDKSISTIPNSRVCTCFRGYYRTHLEMPSTSCTAPPSACQNLEIFEERTRANTITVRWERPEITGRDDVYYNTFYSEDNQTFTQHNTRPYVKQGLLVDYSLSGLKPFTCYTIRVTAENGVSDQVEGGEETRSCEIAGKTGDIRPNAPSLVLGLCTVVVWTSPERTYGRVIGYDVKFVPLDANNVTISKGPRELFHVIKDNEVPMNIRGNTQVQIRAKVPFADGEWSKLVSVGCTS